MKKRIGWAGKELARVEGEFNEVFGGTSTLLMLLLAQSCQGIMDRSRADVVHIVRYNNTGSIQHVIQEEGTFDAAA